MPQAWSGEDTIADTEVLVFDITGKKLHEIDEEDIIEIVEAFDESYIDINKRIITIHSLDKIIMKTKHLEIDAGSSITTKTQTFSESTSTYTMQASNYTTNTSGYKINAPTVNFSANIDAGGTVKGSTISGGSYQGGHH